MKLGEKLEELRERHEQGLITSIEFLKLLFELAREAAQAEKESYRKKKLTEVKQPLRNSSMVLRMTKHLLSLSAS